MEDEVHFLQATDRSSWYLFDQTQEEERQSQPWSYPVVLNPGPLQSVLKKKSRKRKSIPRKILEKVFLLQTLLYIKGLIHFIQ